MHKPRPVQIGFGSADASSHYSLGVPVGNPPLPHLYWTLFYDYDPVGLAAGVSILDVERNGVPVAADVVTVHGPEFLNLTPVPPDPTAIRDLERLE